MRHIIYLSFSAEPELTKAELDTLAKACLAQIKEPVKDDGEPMQVVITDAEARHDRTTSPDQNLT